jgi:hypothetical protein
MDTPALMPARGLVLARLFEQQLERWLAHAAAPQLASTIAAMDLCCTPLREQDADEVAALATSHFVDEPLMRSVGLAEPGIRTMVRLVIETCLADPRVDSVLLRSQGRLCAVQLCHDAALAPPSALPDEVRRMFEAEAWVEGQARRRARKLGHADARVYEVALVCCAPQLRAAHAPVDQVLVGESISQVLCSVHMLANHARGWSRCMLNANLRGLALALGVGFVCEVHVPYRRIPACVAAGEGGVFRCCADLDSIVPRLSSGG